MKIPIKRGRVESGNFVPLPNYSARDIMAEGRGFLQWLSTFCLLFDKKINILLLDEPDAHLHATLQVELLRRLSLHNQGDEKQILIATHSSEVIKAVNPNMILRIDGSSASYCQTDSHVRTLLLGLGVEHFPLLHKIQVHKKVVIVEADFDRAIITAFARKLGTPISKSIVFWPMANNHQERKQVFLHLQAQIPELRVISLEDRDNFDYTRTTSNLSERGFPDSNVGRGAFMPRRWRRCELESYLIEPGAIAALSRQTIGQINQNLQTEFGMHWPHDFRDSDGTNSNGSLFDRDGKTIIEWFENTYNFSKYDLPDNFQIGDIPADIVSFVNQVNALI